jgi:hypothetical protein
VIRQSQNYLAAAVSAALINAAAIGAFVIFTILSSAHGFGLSNVIDAVSSIGSASQESSAPAGPSPGSASALARDAGSGSERLVPNTASLTGDGERAAGSPGSKRGVGESGAAVNGGSASGPSGSGGGTPGSGGSGGSPFVGGTAGPSGPSGPLNIPNTVNNTVGSAAQGVSTATSGASSGLTNTVTDTANGLLGTHLPQSGNAAAQSGGGASATSPATGALSGAVNGASGAVKNTGVKLPGLG